MPQLSIVVPVYNCEKYLASSLDAILNQTFTDFELILVNDGSKDNSGMICEEYGKKDCRISIIHKQNEGSGPARNAGIAIATGEYIAFPDGDDYIIPTMYEELLQQAKKYDADIVYSGVKNVYYNENDIILSSNDVSYPFMYFATGQECKENIMQLKPTSTLFDVPWNKVYRLSVITKNNLHFPPLRRVQDAIFNLEFFNYANSVVSIPNIHYYYRTNDQSKVWMKFPINYIDIVVYYNKRLVELMTQWGVYENETVIFYDSSFIIGVWGTFDFCLNPNWEMSRNQKLEYIQSILNMEYIKFRVSHVHYVEELYKYKKLLQKGSAKSILNEIYRNQLINSAKAFLSNIPYLYKIIRNIRRILC